MGCSSTYWSPIYPSREKRVRAKPKILKELDSEEILLLVHLKKNHKNFVRALLHRERFCEPCLETFSVCAMLENFPWPHLTRLFGIWRQQKPTIVTEMVRSKTVPCLSATCLALALRDKLNKEKQCNSASSAPILRSATLMQ